MANNTIPAKNGTEPIFTISLFDNKKDARPRESHESWPQLFKRLSTPKIRTDKDGPLFSPAKFSPKHRTKQNVKELSLLVLDYDHDATIAEVVAMWQRLGVRFLYYTTHSHQRRTKDHPKAEDRFRVVIPLTEPIPATEFPHLWDWANSISHSKLDSSCKDSSRMFYLPAKASRNAPSEANHFDGTLLDWRKIELANNQTPSANSTAIEQGQFASWDALRAELGRRIIAHETAQKNNAGKYDCRGLCHNGRGNTGIFYDPVTNQAYCNKGCEQAALLRAFGLPEKPVNGIAQAAFSPDQASPESPEWDAPAPLFHFDLPDFPVEALPMWQRSFVESLAFSTQTPIDLAAMMSIAICSAAVARNVRVKARAGWEEPLNIFAAIALPPANRKSQVVADVTRPLFDYERELILSARERIAEEKSDYSILVQELAELEKKCSKADIADRDGLRELAKAKARELAARKLPVYPKMVVDDVTAEVLATILSEQDGRIALFSAEGGIFDTLAGRYSNGTPNIDVLLKGHSGDDVRVDRRDRSEHIERPALSIGLAVQPDVLRGLIEKPGFRGRGLIGRFLYSLPKSTIGHRKIRPTAMTDEIRQTYQKNVCRLASVEPFVNVEGKSEPKLIEFSKAADDLLACFEEEVEPMLGNDGELAFIGDWGGKLAGATVRLAGILHLAQHSQSLSQNWPHTVEADTLASAIQIARYLIPHARMAYAEMAADQKIEDAKIVLRWIEKSDKREFTKRDAFEGTKSRFKQVAALEPALKVLEDHGYIQLEELCPEKRPGRKPSVRFFVNPLAIISASPPTH